MLYFIAGKLWQTADFYKYEDGDGQWHTYWDDAAPFMPSIGDLYSGPNKSFSLKVMRDNLDKFLSRIVKLKAFW
jgi:hypothetical protein